MRKKIILIAIPFLLVLSYYIFITWAFRSFYWTPLGAPPQLAVKVMTYSYTYIAVQTSEDKAYGCNIINRAPCLDWVEVDTVSSMPELDRNYSSSYDLFFVLPLLSKAVDYENNRSAYLPIYMIRSDGSVWHHYEHDTHIYAGFIDYAYLGAITVFLIGVVISGVVFVISRKRQHEEME